MSGQDKAALAQQASQRKLVRYCYECGRIGEVPKDKRDCCPDGSHAVMVPKDVAEQARIGFKQQAAPQAAPQASQGPAPAPVVPLTWYDGPPPFPQDQEWFIAETIYGDRVALIALEEGRRKSMGWGFKTADGIYLKRASVKRWMQFPDCQYIPPEVSAPAVGGSNEFATIKLREWAIARWRDEVENRPLVNKYRRSLDDTWRQVIRFAGGDPDEILGPPHDALLAASQPPVQHKKDA